MQELKGKIMYFPAYDRSQCLTLAETAEEKGLGEKFFSSSFFSPWREYVETCFVALQEQRLFVVLRTLRIA